jgi:hypothetical protein
MPSTYSPSLRLELIGSGEQSGTWGNTTNNNLGTLLEQSIAGVVDISVSSTDVTLTNYNGVSDQSRQSVLNVIGTTSAIRNIIAPLAKKTYIIKNGTVGGFGIVIKASSGTGVTIPWGGTSTVYCNGTNFLLVTGSIPNANQALNNFNFTGAAASTAAGGLVEYAQMNTAILNAQNDTAGTFQKQVFTAFTTSGTSSAFTLPISSLTTASMAKFTGSIAITTGTLTVTAVASGVLYPGMAISGTGITLPGTYIVSQLTGTTGDVGTYDTNQTTAAASTAITGYAGIITNQRFRLKFDETGTGTPTLAVSGLTAKNIKQYNSAGAKVVPVIIADMLVDVEYDGTDYVILNPIQPLNQLFPIGVTESAGAMTVTLNPVNIDFRNSVLNPAAGDTVTTLSVSTAISFTIPSGATLGTFSAKQNKLLLLAINNAGTIELAVCNAWNNTNLNEASAISTTAITAAADSAVTNYSTTARTGVYFRIIGILTSTQTTAGTWATLPTMQSGGAWSPLVNQLTSGTVVTPSGTAVLFTGIPPWAKRITVMFNGVGTNGSSVVLVQVGSGSVLTTGYVGTGGVVQGGSGSSGINAVAQTTGWGLEDGGNSVYSRSGQMVLSLMYGNVWTQSFTMNEDGIAAPRIILGGGIVGLPGDLDRINITTVNGTDTFDASGAINIMYE